MSCFLLSHKHITALVAFVHCQGLDGLSAFRDRTPDEIGRVLLEQNIRSFYYRYEDNLDTTLEQALADVKEYRYKPFREDLVRPMVNIVKAAQCYEYQSCETEEWEKTDAYAMCRTIISEAISMLPGYDKADWSIR